MMDRNTRKSGFVILVRSFSLVLNGDTDVALCVARKSQSFS